MELDRTLTDPEKSSVGPKIVGLCDRALSLRLCEWPSQRLGAEDFEAGRFHEVSSAN